MLLPKRVKHRKQHRGRMTGRAMRGNKIAHGEYGLVALEPAWVTNRQIEAARIAMTRYIKRGGQVWIQIFPDKPITAKPAETRMGKGKGNPEYWVAVVKPGRVLFELEFGQRDVAIESLKLAAQKLPIKVKIIERSNLEAILKEQKFQASGLVNEETAKILGITMLLFDKSLLFPTLTLIFLLPIISAVMPIPE